MENVHNFLKGAQAFGLPAADLFHPDDILRRAEFTSDAAQSAILNAPVLETILALIRRATGHSTTNSSTIAPHFQRQKHGSRQRSTISSVTPTSTRLLASLPKMSTLDDQGLAKVVEHLSNRGDRRSSFGAISSSHHVQRQGGVALDHHRKTPVSNRSSMIMEKDVIAEAEDLRGKKLSLDDVAAAKTTEYVCVSGTLLVRFAIAILFCSKSATVLVAATLVRFTEA